MDLCLGVTRNHFDFSLPTIWDGRFLLSISSLVFLIGIKLFVNFSYNKIITKKIRTIFSPENIETNMLIDILDQYIQKFWRSKSQFRSQKAMLLEQAKSCVNESRDHML